MKLRKHFPTLLGLTAVLTLGVSLYVNINKVPNETDAAQVNENFAPYTYSGTYYDDHNIDFGAGDGMNGALRQKLSSENRPKSYVSYSAGLSTHLQQADEDQNTKTNMVMFYTRDSITKTEANNGGMVWNREHVWPKNLSNNNWSAQNNGTEKCGTDILHLRPTYETPNSTRSNYPFGNVTHTNSTKKTYNSMDYGWLSGGYFEPLDCVKGDVARIIMYVWTTYTDFPNYNPISITNVFESFDTLLEWHTMDKPDTLEGHRNDYVQNSTVQKNRNPFVDHPELAWKIFGDQASSSVKNACMKAYPDNGGVHIDPTGITLDKSTASVEAGKTTQLTATLQPSGATGTVTWTSSNSSIASVNNNGRVTGVAEGTATITATCGDYHASCTVTVTAPVPINYGTLQNPITVAEAKAIIDDESPTTEKMYVKGIVTSATYNTQYSNFDDVYLTDGTNDSALSVFRCVLGDGVDTSYITNASALVGKEIIACGYGYLHNNTKYELAKQNNYTPTVLSVRDPGQEKTPQELIEEKTTGATLAYHYNKETNGDSAVTDTLTRETTGRSGTSYGDWTHTSATSGVGYKGNSAGGNDAIQMRSKNNSGIVVSSNTNGANATSISVDWNTSTPNGKILNVYGKATSYSSPSDLYDDAGTEIGTIVYGTSTSLVITGDYQYIGLRSDDGAIWLNSINIQWGGSATTYEYSNVSIRFGGVVEQDLWSDLDNEESIEGFGVMITTDDVIDENAKIKDSYQSAIPDEENPNVAEHIVDYFIPVENLNTIMGVDGDNYFWNLRYSITDFKQEYVAVAYIKIDSGYVFMRQSRFSVKALANYYINVLNYNANTAGGSLSNLANL